MENTAHRAIFENLPPPIVRERRGLPAWATICALHLITIAAVNRFISPGQERYLRWISATGTGYTVHLARFTLTRATAIAAPAAPPAACLLARRATGGTASWSVGKASTGKKLLLTRGEGKLLITVATIQNLIHVCHMSFSFPGPKPDRYTACSARPARDFPL